MMANGSSIAAATDDVFRHLAEELPRLNPRYLDDTRFLLTVAEVALGPTVDTNYARPEDYEPRLLLHARLPENALAGTLTPDAVDSASATLRAFLQAPRWARLAGVQHFKSLATKERTQASLFFNLLEPSVPGYLSQLSQHLARPDSKIITDRQAALLAKKRQRWADLEQALTERRELTPQEINDLDSFIYEFPDVVALSVPVLGSPLIHCYLAINIAAYYEPSLQANLSRTYFHTLRNAVMPFFLARFASLAEHYISSVAEPGQSVGTRSLRFLRDAAGMLVAKCMSITDDTGADVVQYAPPDLEGFKDGALLTFELPFATRRKVTIRLPQFLAFAPPPDAVRDDDVKWKWSADELDGTDVQARTASTVLASLATLIYQADLANASIILQQRELAERTATLTEREKLIDSAANTLDLLRVDVDRHLRTLSPALAISRPRRLRAFIDSLPQALEVPLNELQYAAEISAACRDAIGQTLRFNDSTRHFLRDQFDLYAGAVDDEKTARVRGLLSKGIVAATQAAATDRVTLDATDTLFATRLVELLLWARFTRDRELRPQMRSVLAWAASEELLTTGARTLYDPHSSMRDYSYGDKELLSLTSTRAGWLVLRSLAADSVPGIVIPLTLASLTAWYHGTEQDVDIGITCANNIVDIEVAVDPPLRGNGKPLVDADVDAASLKIHKFGHCTALINVIFEHADGASAKKTETGESLGYTLKLKVAPQ